MKHQPSLEGAAEEIQKTLYGYVGIQSVSGSEGEREAQNFFLDFFRSLPYWKKHPEHLGSAPIPGDPWDRGPAFAMVRGAGEDTIVLLHHNDVVTASNYKLLKPLAFSPEELEKELFRVRESLSAEARADLESGEYLYGRGVCDMKGGGAIQMVLLRRYSELVLREPDSLPGTLIVLAVPDEENLSAGMRAAATLLARLQKEYHLRFRLAIDSEPHAQVDGQGVFSLGSVGKALPFVYVRGALAHSGTPFLGINPLNILSEIVRGTELNPDFSDAVQGEAAPPPVWTYQRDGKTQYDVSIPLSAAGCLNVLSLNQTPDALLERLRVVCEESFQAVIRRMNGQYAQFCGRTGRPAQPLPWKVQVTSFASLCQAARRDRGAAFDKAYEARLAQLAQRGESLNLIDCTLALVDLVFEYLDDLSPRVVYGLVPPYYPNVSNLFREDMPSEVRDLPETLDAFTRQEFGQRYIAENFFTGVSDMSYTSLSGGREIAATLEESMPLFGKLYNISLEDMERISMPCINIGPCGKDLHQMTERVLKEDLYHRTPRILVRAIEAVLQ